VGGKNIVGADAFSPRYAYVAICTLCMYWRLLSNQAT